MSALRPDERANSVKAGVDPRIEQGQVGAVPDERALARDRMAKGFVMFVLAMFVLIVGLVGYFTYEDYVKPNMPVFVCCIPSVIVAVALMFFGYARRWSMVRQVRYVPVGPPPPGGFSDVKLEPEHSRRKARKVHTRELAGIEKDHVSARPRQTRPVSIKKLVERQKKIRKFLEDLDEQYKDKLLMEETYVALKEKNLRELRDLKEQEKMLEEESINE